MKIHIVTVGVGKRYQPLVGRLIVECGRFAGEDTTITAWVNTLPPGCPQHWQQQYAFKGYACKNVMDSYGPDVLIWMDAATYPIANLQPLFSKIDRDGYYMQENGWNFGEWSSDTALRNFGITREEAFGIPELSSCVFGVDLRKEAGRSFVDDLYRFSCDGSTLGTAEMNDNGLAKKFGAWNPKRGIAHLSDHPRVIGHRSDQTICTFLAWKREWRLTPRPNIVDYKTSWDKNKSPNTVILNHGS